MGIPNLGVTKRVRNALADTASQTVIAIIMTGGFVLIQILVGMEYFSTDAYSNVMVWFGPMQAVILGFYFGINIMRNGRNNGVPSDVQRVVDALNGSVKIQYTMAEQLIELSSTIATMQAKVEALANG